MKKLLFFSQCPENELSRTEMTRLYYIHGVSTDLKQVCLPFTRSKTKFKSLKR